MKFFPRTVDSQFLVRVIKNEVSPEEREFFENWLEESDHNKEEFSSIMLLWDKFQYSHVPSPPPTDEQWTKIEDLIEVDINTEIQKALRPNLKINPAPVKRINTAAWFYSAAATVIVSLSLLLLYDYINIPDVKVVYENISVPQPDVEYYTVATERGQRATLTLPDGSVIQLNSESKLIYPNYFGNDSREIEFEGEGYFKIFPNRNKPFRIKCNNITTVVTGTEFNIKNREKSFSLTVVEGSVKTYSVKSPLGVTVVKGEMVMLKAGKLSAPVMADMNHFLAWRHNKISFSKTPLQDAAAEIQRYYNNLKVRILSDSIKQKTITGIFNTNSLDEILSVMSFTLDVKVSRKGNTIYFE